MRKFKEEFLKLNFPGNSTILKIVAKIAVVKAKTKIIPVETVRIKPLTKRIAILCDF